MTISTTTAKSRYPGDGTTTSFPTGFKFLDNDHVKVILRAAEGGETVWTEGSEYALSGASAPGGGTVTVNTSPTDYTPAVGETLVVKLAVPPRQETSLPLGGAFPSTAVEGMADLAALRDQQVAEALSRAVKFKETTALAEVEFPEPVASRYLAVNGAGDGLEWAYGPGAQVASVFGRIGAVTAALGDYEASQLDNDSGVAGATVADALDALEAGQAGAAILAELAGGDGAGSGLDADLLDGNQASAFERTANKGAANGYAGLDSGGKVPTGQLPDALVGALVYQGTWNAATNTPVLSGNGGGGDMGHYYRVAPAGATNLDGVAEWAVGDYVVNNGAAWEKIDNTDQVVSVHGRQGVVVANVGDYTADQISETAGNKILTAAERTKLAGVAAGAEVNPAVLSQVQAEDGASTTAYSWTPQRVHQAAKDAVPVSLIVALGDETTVLTTGTAKVTFRLPHAMTLIAVRASLTTQSASGNPTFDINAGGATILSTKLSIDAGEKTSTTAATPAAISDTDLADDAEITIDVDAAGTDAAGAKVTLIGFKTTT